MRSCSSIWSPLSAWGPVGPQRPAGTLPSLPICQSYCHTVQQGGRGSGQLCPGGHLNRRGAWGGDHTATATPAEGPAPGEVDSRGRGVPTAAELLVRVCRGVGPAVQPHPPAPGSLGEAARDSLRVFSNLCQIFSEEDNYSQSRELLAQEGSCRPLWSHTPRSPRGLAPGVGVWSHTLAPSLRTW